MNVIARLEFELAYYNVAIYHPSCYTPRTPPPAIIGHKKNIKSRVRNWQIQTDKVFVFRPYRNSRESVLGSIQRKVTRCLPPTPTTWATRENVTNKNGYTCLFWNLFLYLIFLCCADPWLVRFRPNPVTDENTFGNNNISAG